MPPSSPAGAGSTIRLPTVVHVALAFVREQRSERGLLVVVRRSGLRRLDRDACALVIKIVDLDGDSSRAKRTRFRILR